jgi:hypothetical protein
VWGERCGLPDQLPARPAIAGSAAPQQRDGAFLSVTDWKEVR